MSKKNTFIFVAFVLYILAAGTWWSYLLLIKNRDAWEAKQALLRYELQNKGIFDENLYFSSPEYKEIENKYNRQSIMILSEGAALILFLLLGVWQIQKSRNKELELARQQQNFLLSITHELKSPLASIQLSLETFRKHQLPQEKVQKIAGQALNETERLHRHIQIMLLAARMEGGYQYQFEVFDFLQLLQTCIQQVAPKYKGTLHLDYNQQEEHLILADQFTLEATISNLLENAVAYAPDTDEINIRLKKDMQNKAWLLTIADKGKGIAIKERQRIFEKFYRIGNENTRSSKGTGLGLYIVQQFAKAHKGSISVEENKPQGTIFSLTLPI
jgi:signal transduction histidine kinase